MGMKEMAWRGGYNEKGEGLGHEKSGVMPSMGLKVLKSVSKITCSQNLS